MRRCAKIVTPQNRSKKTTTINRTRRSYPQKLSILEDPELIDLREQLFDNPDFSDIPADVLAKLRRHLQAYSQCCLNQREYVNAKKSIELDENIAQELQEQISLIQGSIQKSQQIPNRNQNSNKKYVSF